MIWLTSAVGVGFMLLTIVLGFTAWRLFWAWRDVRRERRDEARQQGRDA